MARNLFAGLKAKQDGVPHSPKYIVQVKPSIDAGDEEYVDITNDIEDLTIETNMEGDPGTASFTILSYEGKYDVVNIGSEFNRLFKRAAMVKIFLGFEIENEGADFITVFLGFVKEGYESKYKVGGKEAIKIKLQDRSFFLQDQITTEYFPNTQLGNMLETILETHSNLSGSGDIDTDSVITALNDLDGAILGAQFVDETVWDIIKMCGETILSAPFFDQTGKLFMQRMPKVTFPAGTPLVEHDWSGTALSSLPEHRLEHNWDEEELSSQVVVLGAIKVEEKRESKKVAFIDPNDVVLSPARGKLASSDGWLGFENETGGTGNYMMDSLFGDPAASGDQREYGVGLQGTVMGYDGTSIEEIFDKSREFGDSENWTLVLQGPFPWTENGNPNFPPTAEPFQSVKTGIADDQGTAGFFPDYNFVKTGTTVAISLDPEPSYRQGWMYFNHHLQLLATNPVGKYWAGILLTEDVWNSGIGVETGLPYPAGGAAPTETEFFAFIAIKAPAWTLDITGGTVNNPLDNTVVHYGIEALADIVTREERFSGTAIDSDLLTEYGTSRYDEVENELLFTDGNCAQLATRIIEARKNYYVKSIVMRELNLEIESGDNVDYYNFRTGLVETISVTRMTVKCSYNPSKGFSTELRAGVLSVDGTAIEVWG